MLVDGGGSGYGRKDSVGPKVVGPLLRKRGISRIDVVVLSHAHDDHVQGLVSVLRDFRVGMVLDTGNPHASESYERFLELVERRKVPYKRAVRGQVIDLDGEVKVRVLSPPKGGVKGSDGLNDESIVLRVTYGRSAILLTGDAGHDAEAGILASGEEVGADVLKVGHHGSSTATSGAWLDAVRPKVAVISVGKNNRFGHPSSSVLRRLAARKITVKRTDRDGAVVILSTKTDSTISTPSSRASD